MNIEANDKLLEQLKTRLQANRVLQDRDVKTKRQDWQYPYGEEQYVLANGEFWEPPTKKKPFRSPIRAIPRHCFQNSYMLVMHEELKLRYVEGFAIRSDVNGHAHFHAWVVTEENVVVDPTWKEGVSYFGVVFPLDIVEKLYLNLKAASVSVLDDWPNGFPILRGNGAYKH
jgi:hypothetical protein